MKTIPNPAAHLPKILIVLFDRLPAEHVTRMAKTAEARQAHILTAGRGASQTGRPIDPPPNLHGFGRAGDGGKGQVHYAIQTARRLGMTHLLFPPASAGLTHDDLAAITATIENHPDAVVVGQPDPARRSATRSNRWRRAWCNFWFRMQTGIALDDVRGGIWIYPLNILASLNFSSRPCLFDLQAPVRAAWAGVTIRRVALAPSGHRPAGHAHRRCAWGNILLRGLMTIHLTMRAITPLPHRKIITNRDDPRQTISVMHPLRSIKTLLTENTTPVQLGLATGMGIFLGALPLIAVHTIVILLAAGFFRLNKVAALAASQLCMPPIVPALCIETGYYLRFGGFLTELSLETLGYQAMDRLFEWLLGALLLGPALAIIAGTAVYLMAIAIRKNIGIFPRQ